MSKYDSRFLVGVGDELEGMSDRHTKTLLMSLYSITPFKTMMHLTSTLKKSNTESEESSE